uniref:Serpentine Receptor, class E (Epsilon) n=1 Tax=Panagrellus redivivus TaxID=6233 RepID=A0A7E4VJJ6_PANRE
MDDGFANHLLHALNGGFGIATFIIMPLLPVYYKPDVKFPKHFGLFYLLTIPAVLTIPLVSFIATVYYFIADTQTNHFFWSLRLVSAYCSNVLQFSIFFMCIDRTLATIFISSYEKVGNKVIVGLFFAIITYTASYFAWLPMYYETATMTLLYLIVISFRSITVIIVFILFYLNRRLNHQVKYNSTLSARYQIIENIKILRVLEPHILLNCFVAPLGAIASLFRDYVPQIHPFPLYYISINFGIFIAYVIAIRRCYLRHKKAKTTIKDVGHPEKLVNGIVFQTEVSVVRNVMGKTVPARLDVNNYFNELKQQWG